MTKGKGRAKPAPHDPLHRPETTAEWTKEFARSVLVATQRRASFGDVERYAFFIGYPRSGHSLVGSLLNAHPEVLIAHELDALGYIEHHFSRLQLYAMLVERDEVFANMGRRWTGYDYVVPDQYQGRWTRLRVIGDKRGRGSTQRLGLKPGLLAKLRQLVGVPIRAIHITRNPYDNIATMARYLAAARLGVPAKEVPDASAWVGKGIDAYAELCGWMAQVRPRFAPDELYEIPYEKFVAEPAQALTEMCSFVGVEAEPTFIAAASGIVWPEVRRKRDSVTWTDEDRSRVDGLIDRYPVLQGYSWDS